MTRACLLAALLAGLSCATREVPSPVRIERIVCTEILGEHPWAMHVIDNTSQGADGVRLADADGDGLPEIVTGWEEGGIVRIYRHPGREKVRDPWPSVTVGRVKSPEDAVLVDLDGDGALDVVSSCEGTTRSMWVHWAPRKEDYFEGSAWRTELLPESQDRMQWMFCLPVKDGLVAAGKNKGAQIGRFERPGDARDLKAWTWRPGADVGWVMSIVPADGGIFFSDRKGKERGVRMLGADGKVRTLGARDREVMFLSHADLDGDGVLEIVVAVREKPLVVLRRSGTEWLETEIPMPANTGTGKAVSVGDLNGDGRPDLVVSCERADGEKSGVFGLLRDGDGWKRLEISGPRGVKFDLVPLLDVDGDGDLDAITCEEVENLGVVWYENPLK